MARVSIIFASTNSGKIDEFKKRLTLGSDSFEIIGLRDLGYTIPECEETGETFQENAILKVIHTQKHLRAEHRRSIIIGDDSGMSIDALDGKPGVHTRRWTGRVLSDDEIIRHCLNLLKAHTNRGADYVTAYALLEPNSKAPHIIQEKTHGEILETPRIESYIQGIPFRCLFYIPGIDMMFHEARELPSAARKKIQIGHEIALGRCRTFIQTAIELNYIKDALVGSWSPKTSYYSEIETGSSPSTGQCAVSALLVQDLLGGEIMKCTAVNKYGRESHFFNRLLGNWDIDLTSDQFPGDTLYENIVLADRNKILSYADTVERYTTLKDAYNHEAHRS